MKSGQWMYNFGDEEHWNECEYFGTKEEAVEAGRIEAIARGEDQYQVGQIQEFVPRIYAEYVMEQINEDAYEECGDNVGNYPFTNKVDQQKLQDLLDEALERWMDKTNNYPTFYKIGNVEDFIL